ncbi:MAG: type II secretion system protein GspJ [Pseudobdellovibrionaceae bacterium]
MKNSHRSPNICGFTLIEVMISITILASLMVLAAKTFQGATESKKKIQTNLDEVSVVRDALKILELDINRAFHYRDIEKEIETLAKKASKSTKSKASTGVGSNGSGAPPVTPPIDPGASQDGGDPNNPDAIDPTLSPEEQEVAKKRISPVTFFMGSDNKIDFVTLNADRMIKDAQQADFAEVNYFLDKCQNKATDVSSNCLLRRTVYIVGPEPAPEIEGKKQVLLENVSEFKLRYMGEGKQDWVTEWKTGEGGDGVTKGRFPDAVEVSLTVTPDPKQTKKKVSMQIVVPIRFPNNPQRKQDSGAGATTQ